MAREQMLTAALLLGLLAIAVVSDVRRHRIPNQLILAGLAVALALQLLAGGVAGLGNLVLGMLVGFGLFIPLYALGGMAAGDVKLMAMAGAFLTPTHAVWMAFFSLIAGSLCGLLIILVRGQLGMTLSRYWLILLSRTHVAPAADEVAGKPFPYSVAILFGVLLALVWRPFDPWLILGYAFG
ncbi:A24 family peptidase [Pseudomonas sp. Gutcm_11s]|uniref:A24 family peptidase n=1 Tax=Pseudomonas sp. Gutcm_11s TaxID=3026088 RepID=UPI00236284A6|nr:prepilin peptidase [Pseudomonas sp. Gutcm_11s]MDD0843776.1 prepilin peptidase [Pseudomonas sp. Gutcm_11s]